MTTPSQIGSPEEILDEVQTYLEKFIAYPSKQGATAHTVWIVQAHLVDEFYNTPRLAFLSPEPGSGKSRALELTEALVPRPELTVNNSVSSIFRSISDEEGKPTLLLDEADAVFSPKKADGNEDLRALLNSGYRKGAFVKRTEARGRNFETVKYPSFCAVAFAGLHRLPDTLMTRSVIINMKRRRPDQKVQSYRPRKEQATSNRLRERIAEYADSIRDRVGELEPDLPATIEDRDADLWEPLIAIADLVGGHWPNTVREAAVWLVAQSKDKAPTLGVKLLTDIRQVFGETDRVSTHDLLERLHALESSPWGNFRGAPIDARYLARTLDEYEIKPSTHRFSEHLLKGYLKSDFFDAWARYLPEEAKTEIICEKCGEPIHPKAAVGGFTTCPSCDLPPVTPVTPVTHFSDNRESEV